MSRSLALGHLAILPGPCDWSRPVCSKAPTSTGSSRWSSSRSPSAGAGPGTASATRPPCARPPRRGDPGARLARRRWRAVVGWIRRLRADARRGPRRAARSIARPIPATGSCTFPWVGAERALTLTEAALALAERDVSPSRTAHLTGAQERLVARWTERIAAARTTPPDLGPRRRPPDPDRVDLGDQRQEHGDPADHAHPAARRAARRDDDLGRRPRRRADGRAGRLDRARAARTRSSPGATSTSPSSRPPAAGSSCAASATSRTTRAC